MSDLNTIVIEVIQSCIEHLESAARYSDNGDIGAREYHLDVVHERLANLIEILR